VRIAGKFKKRGLERFGKAFGHVPSSRLGVL
jgi:hypothetical protein